MSQSPPNSPDSFLVSLGWNEFFQASFDEHGEQNLVVGRVIGQGRGHYQLQVSKDETLEAAITTKLQNSAKEPGDFPTVGDWVALVRGQGSQQSSIQRVLKRKNFLQRRRSGAQQGIQLIAANLDFMLVVSSCNEDFDLERLGRYFELGRDSGCTTVLLLTKSDLGEGPEQYIRAFQVKFQNVEVLTLSNKDPQSLEALQRFFSPGLTSVLVGSSGVGKSTLTNYLLGFEAQKTQGLSTASKGRHTTTARHLRFTRWGGLVIDTPGMQEISAVNDSGETLENFSDVEESTLKCKFTDCQHKSEPGCAIREALKTGTLSTQRFEEYLRAKAKSAPRGKRNARSTRPNRP